MRRRCLFTNRNSYNSSNPLYTDAVEIYSTRRIVSNAIYCMRIKRTSDNAETDILLPDNINEFISMDSSVSAGGTLANWVGSSSAIAVVIYGQKDFKNLEYTGSDFKLIINGVLQTSNDKPTLNQYNIFTGTGYKATGLNGGFPLANASIFQVYGNLNLSANTRPLGFGNVDEDGLSGASGKKHWNVASDNSLRYDGGAITNNNVTAIAGSKIRASFKNGDTYSDYINGVENISPTVLTGTSIVDDFFIGPLIQAGYADFRWSEAIIFLEDKTALLADIQTEQNSAFNIY
jgi:hypothetical protein